MRAVKAAERQAVGGRDHQDLHRPGGDPAYGEAMRRLILGDAVAADRVAAAATPGGTGAIRQALELIRLAAPDATVWMSAPTWPNHPSIIRYLGMKTGRVPLFRRGQPRRRFRRDAGRSGARRNPATWCCCTAAATTRPAPTRRPSDWGRIVAAAAADRRRAAGRPRLSGLWRRARRGRRRHPPDRGGAARGADRRLLLEELRHLPRTRRAADGDLGQGRGPRRHPGHARVPEPAELFLPARPRRPAGDDDP